MPIIPITDRTPEERREIARKGGRTKAENARKHQALHACKYDDVAKLRGEVASLARCLNNITKELLSIDPHNDKLRQYAFRTNQLSKEIDASEQKDVNRLFNNGL